MENRSSPRISSFVLRFVQEEPENSGPQPNCRGSIRHIQTDQEISFTHWTDALNFMSQFVPGEVLGFTESSTPLTQDGQVSE